MLWHFINFGAGDFRLSRMTEVGECALLDMFAEQPIGGLVMALGCATAEWDDYGWARLRAANGR